MSDNIFYMISVAAKYQIRKSCRRPRKRFVEIQHPCFVIDKSDKNIYFLKF